MEVLGLGVGPFYLHMLCIISHRALMTGIHLTWWNYCAPAVLNVPKGQLLRPTNSPFHQKERNLTRKRFYLIDIIIQLLNWSFGMVMAKMLLIKNLHSCSSRSFMSSLQIFLWHWQIQATHAITVQFYTSLQNAFIKNFHKGASWRDLPFIQGLKNLIF